MNENKQYCKRIVDELESIYNGEITNEDGVTMLEYLGKLYGVPFGAHIDEENGANPPRKMTVKF
jgi:hypothetical protein